MDDERLERIEKLLREVRDDQRSFRTEFRAGHQSHHKLKAHKVAELLGCTADHVRRLDRRRNDFPASRLDENGHRYWLLGELRVYLDAKQNK